MHIYYGIVTQFRHDVAYLAEPGDNDHESWSFREAIILVKGDLILAAFPCALVSPYPDPLTTKIAARSIANGCRNFGETAAVPALKVPTDEEGGQHVHLWRLSGTY